MDSDFWNHSLAILGASIVIAALLRGAYFFIMAEQVVHPHERDEYRSCGTRSCAMGCILATIILFFSSGSLFAFVLSSLWDSPKKEQLQEQKRKESIQIDPLTQGPLSILAKEKPMLFEHYRELERASAVLTRLKETEESSRNAMRNRNAREQLNKSIAHYKKSIRRYAELKKKVETQAGYLYFARFLSNLGRRFNESSLQHELEKSESELKQELELYKNL